MHGRRTVAHGAPTGRGLVDQSQHGGPRVSRAGNSGCFDDTPGHRHIYHPRQGGLKRRRAAAAAFANGQRICGACRRRRVHAAGSNGPVSGIAIGKARQEEVVMTPFSSSLKTKGSALAESGPISSIGLALFIVCALLGGIVTMALNHPAPLFAGGFIGLYFMFAIKVADQWEKAAVLRLGRYRGLFGPGAFHIIPIVDSISRVVDQRDRKSTRLNSSHSQISYAVFCLKKKKTI